MTFRFIEPGNQHRNDRGDAQRYFVADHLGGFPHATEQRPLRAARVAGENDAQHFQRKNRQGQEQSDFERDGDPVFAEREEQERAERGDDDDVRGEPKQHVVGGIRSEVFLLDQLDPVRQRLQPAELASHPRRTEPVLDAACDLSLGPDEHKRGKAEEGPQQRDVNHGGENGRESRRDAQVVRQEVRNHFGDRVE